MAEINIDPRNRDGFGRYKMPRLLVQVEKGSRTVLINLNAVAKSLDRSPTDLSKFLRCQLSTQVNDRPKEDRYIFSGVHLQDTFQSYLYDYIDRFVLCTICGNPETSLTGQLRMNAKLRQSCKACGYGSTIHIISQNLATRRLNQASDQVAKIQSSDTDTDIDDDHDELLYSSGTTSKNIQIQRNTQFEDYLKEKKSEQKVNETAAIEEIGAKVKFLDLDEEAPSIAAQVLLTQDILKELDDSKALFNKLCSENAKGQQSLLRTVENLFFKLQDTKEKRLNKKTILKFFVKLYDYDIIEEENFYIWHETASQEMKDISMDFIQWLRTAEESSGEEH